MSEDVGTIVVCIDRKVSSLAKVNVNSDSIASKISLLGFFNNSGLISLNKIDVAINAASKSIDWPIVYKRRSFRSFSFNNCSL